MKKKKICYYCGNEIEEGEEYDVILSNGEVVHACYDCSAGHAYFCEYCENTYDNGVCDYTTIDGSTICENCYNNSYFTCDDCGEIVHTNNINHVSSTGAAVCDNCYNENYFICDACGDVYHVSERTF